MDIRSGILSTEKVPDLVFKLICLLYDHRIGLDANQARWASRVLRFLADYDMHSSKTIDDEADKVATIIKRLTELLFADDLSVEQNAWFTAADKLLRLHKDRGSVKIDPRAFTERLKKPSPQS
jgi:hypothetical protein